MNPNLKKFEDLVSKDTENRIEVLSKISEMLHENFIYTFWIDKDVCDDLIRYHKNNKEYKGEGIANRQGIIDKEVKESIDVTFFNSSTDDAIKKYFDELGKGYREYLERYKIEHFNLNTEERNNIQYYPAGGGFKVWHWERDNGNANRQLVYMTYLNDVENGGTEWLYQDVKIEAKKGLSVIWPADFLFAHRGIVSHTQEKWIATGWFSYV